MGGGTLGGPAGPAQNWMRHSCRKGTHFVSACLLARQVIVQLDLVFRDLMRIPTPAEQHARAAKGEVSRGQGGAQCRRQGSARLLRCRGLGTDHRLPPLLAFTCSQYASPFCSFAFCRPLRPSCHAWLGEFYNTRMRRGGKHACTARAPRSSPVACAEICEGFLRISHCSTW